MSDYRVINDNGYERTWEELYEDNVRFQKYTDELQQENEQLKDNWNKLKDYINKMQEMEKSDSNE